MDMCTVSYISLQACRDIHIYSQNRQYGSFLEVFKEKNKAPDEAEKNILLTYCFVTQIMLILVTHCSVNVKTSFIIKEGYVCVLKTLNQKIRKFTGFQQSAAKLSTGRTVSTVPAE